jgi:periplasmic protein CpxP/Spy
MFPMRKTAASLTASALVIVALSLPVAAVAQVSPGTAPAQSGATDTANPSATTTAPAAKPMAPKTAAKSTMTGRRSSPDQVEQRITQLHSDLKITSAQQPQWDQFAAVMRSNATDTNQAYIDRSNKIATMSAADIMSSYVALSMQHSHDLQKLATAFQALYSSMTPDQQKTADQVFRGSATHHHS